MWKLSHLRTNIVPTLCCQDLLPNKHGFLFCIRWENRSLKLSGFYVLQQNIIVMSLTDGPLLAAVVPFNLKAFSCFLQIAGKTWWSHGLHHRLLICGTCRAMDAGKPARYGICEVIQINADWTRLQALEYAHFCPSTFMEIITPNRGRSWQQMMSIMLDVLCIQAQQVLHGFAVKTRGTRLSAELSSPRH